MSGSESVYTPVPPPTTRLWGLRFNDPADEDAYLTWRTEHVRPFMRFSFYAAASSAVFAWFAVLFGALVDLRVLALVLIAFQVVLQVMGALSTYNENPRSVLIWATTVNCFGGFLAISMTWPLHDPAVTGAVVTMTAYAGLTMFRLRPALALASVSPYILGDVAATIRWNQQGLMPANEFAIGLFIPLTALFTGMIINLAIEWITRNSYLDHRVIACQQDELFEERTSIARFLSPEVVGAIHEHGLEATVRTQMLSLTAVSIDLRGFTHYTQIHGAVRMADVLRDYYEAVVEVARKYGATVKDFSGDGAMVLVGAPLQRADHTRIGLNLARAMLGEVREVTGRHSLPGTSLGAGIGIASGECAVGPIGSLTQLEYTAVGTAVNLSSRLCDVAEDGQILMGPGTAHSLEESPGWRRQQFVLSGIPEPVEVTIEDTLSGPHAIPTIPGSDRLQLGSVVPIADATGP